MLNMPKITHSLNIRYLTPRASMATTRRRTNLQSFSTYLRVRNTLGPKGSKRAALTLSRQSTEAVSSRSLVINLI